MLHSIIIKTSDNTLDVLEDFLANSPAIQLDKKFMVVKEAESYCKHHSVDIIFSNINIMEKETIERIKYIQPSTMIVCAGTREVIEKQGFEENIFAYLYKPFSYERILSVIEKANTYMGYSSNANGNFKKRFVFIKSEYKTIRVDLNTVLYCEGLKDYTQIYIAGRQKPLVTLQNLKSISEKLPASDFIRVHRSFIVSMEKIDTISRNEISIGSSEIPIGDAYRDKLIEMIGNNS